MWWFKRRVSDMPVLGDYEVRTDIYVAGVKGVRWHENRTVDPRNPERQEILGKVYLHIDDGSTRRTVFEDKIPVPLAGNNDRLKTRLERHGLDDHTDWKTFYALMEPVLIHYRDIFDKWRRTRNPE